MFQLLTRLLLILVFAVLSACGSSGGGGSTPADNTVSLTASETIILPGNSAQLIAEFSSTATGIIDNGIGDVTSGTPVSASPSSTTTYTLTVTGDDGAVTTASVTITVLALASLELVDENLDQVFQPQLNSYTAGTGFLARSARIRASTDIPDAVITVNSVAIDEDGYSQLVTLTEGDVTNINTVVTLGEVSNAYTIAVTRSDFASLAQEAYVKASNTGGSDNGVIPNLAGDNFGYSVAFSGDTLVVGAPIEDADANSDGDPVGTDNNNLPKAGAAYVFVRNGSTWEQQAYLKASNPETNEANGDEFGTSVAIFGDTIVIGAPKEDSDTTSINSTPNENATQSGAAYIFTRSGSTWSQQAYLKAGNAEAEDNFGKSVAIHNNTVIVSATGEDSRVAGINQTPIDDITGSGSGAVYVFVRDQENNWSQQAYVKSSNPGTSDAFGNSVSVFSNTLVVGAELEDSDTAGINPTTNNSAIDSGAVYIFIRDGTTWSQQAFIKASNNNIGDNNGVSIRFGHNVSMDGDSLAVGAHLESTTNNASGAAYVFSRSGTTWTQQGDVIKASNNDDTNDNFGFSVSLSGDTLVVGATREDSNADTVSAAPTGADTGSSGNSGAAYVFTRSSGTWSETAYLKAGNVDGDDLFGSAVAIAGDSIAVGAIQESGSATGIDGLDDNAEANSGAIYVFE